MTRHLLEMFGKIHGQGNKISDVFLAQSILFPRVKNSPSDVIRACLFPVLSPLAFSRTTTLRKQKEQQVCAIFPNLHPQEQKVLLKED